MTRYNIKYSNFSQKGGTVGSLLIFSVVIVIVVGLGFFGYKQYGEYIKKSKEGKLCDTRKDESKPDSCMNCDYGYKNVGINDECCNEKEASNCNVLKSGDSTAGAICDTRNKQGTKNSCLDCRYGYRRKELNDWCCQKFEEKDCNKIKTNPDGSKSVVNIGSSICDTRKKQSEPDSCLNCEHGYTKVGLNDWCCQEKEKDNCNVIITNPDGSKGFGNIGGSICDTRKGKEQADSCLNCEYGRVRKGANDWCCRKEENCFTDNPDFVYPSKNQGGSICDTRKGKEQADSCLNCEYGRVRKGANDWCCRNSENCFTDNPNFVYPSKNQGGTKCDTRKTRDKADSCLNCEYGRVRIGLDDWCCRKEENCETDNTHYVEPFWSNCYKDEDCGGNRDTCIKRDCTNKGLKYKKNWQDCGKKFGSNYAWKFRGKCE
jgi:hypothetical protein